VGGRFISHLESMMLYRRIRNPTLSIYFIYSKNNLASFHVDMLARRLGMLFLLVYTTLPTSVNLKNHLRPSCSNEHSSSLSHCITVVLFFTVLFYVLLFVTLLSALGQHCRATL